MARHISGRDIGRYADGEVGRDEALRLGRHLESCGACRRRLQVEQALTVDLRAYFAVPLPAAAAAGRRGRFDLRVPAAAAVLLLGFLAFPAASHELASPPLTGASAVMPFALGVQVKGGQSWSDLATWTGFVVGGNGDELQVRVGAQVLTVELPSGGRAAAYPVGSAVAVRGTLLRAGVVSAAAVQQIEP